MPFCAVLTPWWLTESFTAVNEKYHACFRCHRMLSTSSMRGCSAMALFSVVPVDVAVLHDESHVERGGDVTGWIARHGDDVGEISRRDASQFVVGLDQLGARDGCRTQGLHRRHAAGDQRTQFLGVLAMRNRGCVSAAG